MMISCWTICCRKQVQAMATEFSREFFADNLTGEGTYDYVEKLMGNFMPKEVLYDRARKNDFEKYFGSKYCTFELDDWVFTEQSTKMKKIQKNYELNAGESFRLDKNGLHGVTAQGRIKMSLLLVLE